MKARRTPLAVLAIALLSAVAQPADASIDLSRVRGLISDFRSNIDLPPRAEEAIDRALERAGSVLDRVFGDQDSDDTTDVPNGDTPTDDTPDDTTTPDLGDVVDSARDRVQQAIEDARSRARAAIDRALGRARSALDSVNIDLPNIDLPNLDFPSLTLPEIDLPQIDLPDLLDDLDLPALIPDVTPIIDQPIEDIVDDVADVVDGVIDGLDGPIVDVINDVIDSSDPLETILDNLPIDRLPPIAQEAIESVLGRFIDAPTPLASQLVSVPEPGALSLLAIGLLSGGVARRRR